MQLGNHLKAVLTGVNHVDTLQFLLFCQEQGLSRDTIFKSLWRQFVLQLPDVVLKHGFEAALQIEEGTATTELQAPVQ